MALSLNTSHPLYADLIGLFCVDEDDTIKDLTGNNTCTPHANVVVGSGTYGRHFRTFVVSNNAQGVALSPGVPPKPSASPVCSIFVAVNAANSRASRGTVFQPGGQAINPAVYTGDVVGIQSSTGKPTLLGTTDLIGTGAHSFGAAWNGVTGQLGHKVFADGLVENSSSSNFGNASDATFLSYIGGGSAEGYGGLEADYVWIAVFRRYLSDSEIAELHRSLGPGNVFSLIDSGSATTEISATLASVVGSVSSKAGSIHSISAALANISGSLTSGSGSLVTTISVTLANIVGAVSSVPVQRTALSATLANVFGSLSSYPYGTTISTINAVLGDVFGSLASKSAPVTAISAALGNVVGSLNSKVVQVTTITATLGNVIGSVSSYQHVPAVTKINAILGSIIGNVKFVGLNSYVRAPDGSGPSVIRSKSSRPANVGGYRVTSQTLTRH